MSINKSKWWVRYLIRYDDVNRWGESKAYGRRNAFEWASMIGKAVLEIHIYFSEKCIASYTRDERGAMRRVVL